MKADAYRLATASDVAELEALVNGLLDEGWELYGETICQSTVLRSAQGADRLVTGYHQALIRKLQPDDR